MNFAERFEDLRIWQEARVQVQVVYRALKKGTAGHEDLGFRNQMQRASISVMNNIAEGFERKTSKDFAHFLDLAKGSCGEVRSMLYVSEDLKYLKYEEAEILRASAEKLSRGIAAFANHLRS
jgi:four helix bundle protein